MFDVTFITPVATYHTALLERAAASVAAQTVPCAHVVVQDPDGRGPAWARNRGLEKAHTPFVVFLDADDWVEPTFAERCLEAWEPRRYVYTDWYEDGTLRRAPGNPWCDDLEWHVITALIPKWAADEVGGFKTMPGGEDSEFYWALTRRVKCCGLALHEPLFHYGREGQRARTFLNVVEGQPVNLAKNPQYQQVMRDIIRSYGNMGCCSDQVIQARQTLPGGEPGDVLVRAMWGGNRQVLGPVSGRLYPRSGNGRLMMVDPADAQARPDLWQPVEPSPTRKERPAGPPMLGNLEVQRVDDFDALVDALFPRRSPPEVTLESLQNTPVARVQPDVRKIADLTRGLYG